MIYTMFVRKKTLTEQTQNLSHQLSKFTVQIYYEYILCKMAIEDLRSITIYKYFFFFLIVYT